jgi:catechol 2,3-dioxygenase-like lactoylglutathione lyase family enzyme
MKMIDHIGIAVSNYERSKQFYIEALKPIGYELLIEVEGFAGFGSKNTGGAIATFWLHEEKDKVMKGMHIAFSATNRKLVDAFYDAAIRAQATDNGKPGVREHYHPNYYGAFVLDPDGYNIEAVCHQP